MQRSIVLISHLWKKPCSAIQYLLIFVNQIDVQAKSNKQKQPNIHGTTQSSPCCEEAPETTTRDLKYSNSYYNSYWVEQLKDSQRRLQDKLFFSLQLGVRLSQKEFCRMEDNVQYSGNPIISRNTLKVKEFF
jgi:hypothetical protein